MTVVVVAGVALLAWSLGYWRGEQAGVELTRGVGALRARAERGRCDERIRAARLEEIEAGRERCRTQVIQRLYGPMLIARPSAAARN